MEPAPLRELHLEVNHQVLLPFIVISKARRTLNLVAISPNNCHDSITLTSVITVVNPSGISNLKSSNIKVYPNPVRSVFKIFGITGNQIN
jgi:hypothetical protein